MLISYWFPPRLPESAGRHAAGLTKYFPEFGWEPLVLTAALPGKPDGRYHVVETPYHDSLGFFKKVLGIRSEQTILMNVAEVKKKLRITSETSPLDVILKCGGEIFAYPDAQRGWRASAVRVASESFPIKSAAAVLSISPPVTAHLIARDIKRKYGIPWVAHFHDLWTQNHYYPYGPLRHGLEQKLERGTMSWADSLVTISQPLAEKLSQLHQRKPTYVITGGFDPEEFGKSPPQLSAKFTITYTGNIYPKKQSPEPLFKALAELILEGIIAPKDVEVRFYGPELGWVQRQIASHHFEEVVKQFGIVPWQLSLEKQRESQLLLLLDWTDPNELGVYTGKVFEYLCARRPILAVGGSSNGVLHKLLEETKSGVHCSTVEEVKNFLRQAYREYKLKGQVGYQGNQEKIMNYSYKQMSHRFSELLSRLAPTMRQDTDQ